LPKDRVFSHPICFHPKNAAVNDFSINKNETNLCWFAENVKLNPQRSQSLFTSGAFGFCPRFHDLRASKTFVIVFFWLTLPAGEGDSRKEKFKFHFCRFSLRISKSSDYFLLSIFAREHRDAPAGTSSTDHGCLQLLYNSSDRLCLLFLDNLKFKIINIIMK
jgi:hypothetical protein